MLPSFGFAPTTAPDASRVRSARIGVLSLFGFLGLLTATFLSRVPSMRDLLDVSPAGLATLLIFGAVGALTALLITGWAAARLGTRALLWWSNLSYLGAISMVGLATMLGDHVLFAAGYFLVSFSFAFTNVAMNTEAARIERRVGRAIMPQFHAGFSLGMAIGLGVGVLFSHAGIAPLWHFLIVGTVATVARLFIVPLSTIDGRPDPDAAAASLGGPFATAKAEYRDPHVILIGMIVFAGAMTENVAAQWLPLSVVDDFGLTESTADLVYWVFVVAMVTVRWFGARVIGRLGRVVSLRASAVLVASGVLLYAFTPAVHLVPVAAALWGMGAALGAPIGFSAAADDPARAAARMAAVSSFSTIAGLVVPQLVGRVAELVELRYALLLVLVAATITFTLARAVRSPKGLFRSRRAQERAVGAAVLAADEAASLSGSDTAGIPGERVASRWRRR
ncbi:MFS transporter [Demequina capsici]|uniref:MFS transporter n=1 Tax=Demequina capsici TaxID=3075620 RepID=A0AA96J959_9MICO|nr:MFS transporter [Demequina sp. PMTSA13]WNM26952.1 MFS transporter [Demequina sp. PMTSA13]